MGNLNLETLEQERKNIKKKNTIRVLIGVGVLLIGAIIWFLTEQPIVLAAGIVVLIIMIIINATKSSKYRVKFKETIVRNLVKEELGADAVYNINGGLSLSEINSLRCMNVPDRYHLSDYIKASYNGVPYEICDCHFEERRVTYDSKGNKKVTYVTYFKGRAIKIDFKRDLNVVMKLVNQGPLGFSTEGLKKFETEVIDFNKKFKCYVDDTEKAFYVLTPVFIQKLMQLEKMFRGGLVFAFKHNNLYVFINDSSDSLEVSFNKPLNGEQIERIRGEIILPATIINEFRIDDDKFNINR